MNYRKNDLSSHQKHLTYMYVHAQGSNWQTNKYCMYVLYLYIHDCIYSVDGVAQGIHFAYGHCPIKSTQQIFDIE